MTRRSFIHISGSANAGAEPRKLQEAHLLVQHLTRAFLRDGFGMTVLLGVEPVHETEGGDSVPLTFDWTVLGTLDTMIAAGEFQPDGTPRIFAVVAPKNLARLTDAHRDLLARLMDHLQVEVHPIPDEIYTGGAYRDAILENSEAMIGIGGGKGVSSLSAKFRQCQKPVFPFDLAIGAINDDGQGALGLYRQALSNPETIISSPPPQLLNLLVQSSRETPLAPLERASGIAHEVLKAEVLRGQHRRERQAAQHGPAQLVVMTALPVELAAVRRVLGISEQHAVGLDTGVLIYRTAITGRDRSTWDTVVACSAGAGNYDMAALTAELVFRFRPSLLVMSGIAGGVEGKCLIGDVLIADRIVAYESAALVDSSVSGIQPRPDVYRIEPATEQQVAHFMSLEPNARITQRLREGFRPWPWEDSKDVAQEIRLRTAALASGEKLIRDGTKMARLRAEIHGRIEAAEMEAVGVAVTARRLGCEFLVVRGISDLANSVKNDDYHWLASLAAAYTIRDFLEHSLRPPGKQP
jgi:nucleoside phosphorylase